MISVVTPSVRYEMLEVVKKCLGRQTYKDFEWIVVSPDKYAQAIWVSDPPKREGDYYRLNAAWNEGFRKAQGELIVSIQDGIWFPSDLLEKLWSHYQNNPRALVSAIGHQYEDVINGKPEGCVWKDPRQTTQFGTFYEVSPRDVEYCVASIPRQALFDVGGLDEEFDKYAALSEKEMNYRMDKLGYRFFLDQSLEYRAIKHPRLSEEWEERYEKGCEYYQKCLQEIDAGGRSKLDYLVEE